MRYERNKEKRRIALYKILRYIHVKITKKCNASHCRQYIDFNLEIKVSFSFV